MKGYLPASYSLSVNTSLGFTLIELLVVVTIITILAVAVYSALNPAQRIRDTRDARRAQDVSEILSAIHQSIVDDKGTLPTNLAAMANDAEQQLGTGNTTECGASVGNYCSGLTTGCVNLMSGAENLTNYIDSIPIDPIAGSTATSVKTGYSVKKGSNGVITIKACYTDSSSVIKVSR